MSGQQDLSLPKKYTNVFFALSESRPDMCPARRIEYPPENHQELGRSGGIHTSLHTYIPAYIHPYIACLARKVVVRPEPPTIELVILCHPHKCQARKIGLSQTPKEYWPCLGPDRKHARPTGLTYTQEACDRVCD